MTAQLLLALLGIASSTPTGAGAPPVVEIQAPEARWLAREGRTEYSGGVTVRRAGTTLTCDTLTAWLAQGQKGPGAQRVQCDGHVQAVDGERTASGERATFDNGTGVLELTGNPEARQGPHQLRGTVVRFHTGTDRLEVEQAETLLVAAPRAKGSQKPGAPVRVTAPLLKVSNREGRAVYSGGVTALRGGTQMRCRRATVHYTPGEADGAVKRVECVGDVEARDGDRWARGERATFEAASGTLVLTGEPELHQGPVNVTRGQRVLFHLDTDTVEVERPETVLQPASTQVTKEKTP